MWRGGVKLNYQPLPAICSEAVLILQYFRQNSLNEPLKKVRTCRGVKIDLMLDALNRDSGGRSRIPASLPESGCLPLGLPLTICALIAKFLHVCFAVQR